MRQRRGKALPGAELEGARASIRPVIKRGFIARSNFEWVAAIAVNPAAHQHAAVLGRIKDKPSRAR
jgi:hypothetical protein